MSSATAKTPASAPRPKPLRIGFLALTDAAPFVVAEHLGLFTRHQLNVELRREIGWATIREKIIYGELDAAHAPAPMLWSTQLGLGCPPCDVLTALVLSLTATHSRFRMRCGRLACAMAPPFAPTPAPSTPATR